MQCSHLDVPPQFQSRFGATVHAEASMTMWRAPFSDTTHFKFKLKNLDEEAGPWVITAWLLYNVGADEAGEKSIFAETARAVIPLSPSDAAYCNGHCQDHNT